MSTETHIFVVFWGEFGSLLEDIAILTSLPLFKDAHAIGTLEEEDQKRVEFLKQVSVWLEVYC